MTTLFLSKNGTASTSPVDAVVSVNVEDDISHYFAAPMVSFMTSNRRGDVFETTTSYESYQPREDHQNVRLFSVPRKYTVNSFQRRVSELTSHPLVFLFPRA